MPGQAWCVIGGKQSGGILVRAGQETESAELADRLSCGAIIKEKSLSGSRLEYDLMQGTGPDSGWVSTSVKGKDMVVKLWQIVGTGAGGGILVREGEETSSAEAPKRLGKGAVVKELKFTSTSNRLQFELLKGNGPSTGWVSTKLKDNTLACPLTDFSLVTDGEQPPKASSASAPLEILTFNADKEFSYDGLPVWVPKAAAARKLRREGKPYTPTAEAPLERLSRTKPLGEWAPFKKLTPKKLKEAYKQNLPGAVFGLPFPYSATQMMSEEFGVEWFNKAFQAAGTLPDGNRVTKITAKEISGAGHEKSGGAGSKALIDVEWQNPDPKLPATLFAKYTFDLTVDVPGELTKGQDDSLEVAANMSLVHTFPFPTPQFFWGDVCRETTVYLLIWDAIPYKSHGEECSPYDILPTCGKCQDHLLPQPQEYYCTMFRALGRLAAWDKLGTYDWFYGPSIQYSEADTLKQVALRPPVAISNRDAMATVVGKAMDRIIDFIMNWCEKMVPPEVHNREALEKVKKELVEMCPYFKDMSDVYQANHSKYLGLCHANLQADNAFFWRDEYEDLNCGMLDWGGVSRGPLCTRFLGSLSGADAEVLQTQLPGILQAFCDEYQQCGGPKIEIDDFVQRYHLAFASFCYANFDYTERHTFRETTQEEFLKFSGRLDPEFQKRFFTRCGCLPILNAWTYYIRRGDIKKIFDEWSRGVGKPYLTKYEG